MRFVRAAALAALAAGCPALSILAAACMIGAAGI